MLNYLLLFTFFLTASLQTACPHKAKPEDPTLWKKVKVDLNRLDENGLAGQPDAKVAVNYEFCIPSSDAAWREVKKIDASAELQKGSKGRVGCDKNSWLVIGSTHQKNHRRVLYELASLAYIQIIQETYFE